MAKICKDIQDIGFARFYLFVRFSISLDMEKILEAYFNLNSDGCIELNRYYIYYKHRESVMKQLAEEELLSKLEDVYEVSAMFKDEELADMWIFSTSKEQASKEHMEEHDWSEILEVEQAEFGFKDSEGYEVYYCYKCKLNFKQIWNFLIVFDELIEEFGRICRSITYNYKYPIH